MRGMTIIELLVTISLFFVLAALASPIYTGFQLSSQLNESTKKLINKLELQKSKSIAAFNNKEHGIKFFSNYYVMFQGESYEARNSSLDENINLNNENMIMELNLGDADELVFEKGTGNVSATGTISLVLDSRLKREIKVLEYQIFQDD